MKAVVTGGAGFIGHHLVAGLLEQGHEVAVIDDFSTGLRERLAPFRGRISVAEGSILDAAALDTAFSGCEVVFHEAAIASVARSFAEPRLTEDVNVGGTIEVLLAAARSSVRRVVFAGSSAVYGVPEGPPSSERDRTRPTSPYGASKLAAEYYLHSLGELHGIETAVLRYFNVYGPGQDPTAEYAAVIPRFIAAVLDGRRPTIYGSPDISRDFVHVDDVVDANLLAAGTSSPPRGTWNVASGSRTSLGELLQAVAAATGRDVEPLLETPRPGDIAHSQASIALAQQELGYTVGVPLREGISRLVAWFREAPAI